MSIQTIQIKRGETPATVPTGLQPGELAVEMAVPARLWVGVPVALEPTGKKLLVDTSVPAGIPQADADLRYVNTAGDTMTGALTLPADPTVALHAATKQYVDAQLAAVDHSIYLQKSGGAMTGYLTLIADAPTFPEHAAHKAYVDATATGSANAAVSNRVIRTGDTMTGPLNLFGPTNWAYSAPGAGAFYSTPLLANKWFLGTEGVTENMRLFLHPNGINVASFDGATGHMLVVGDPTAALGVATKQYVDARAGGMTQAQADAAYVNITGDTMTGRLSTTGLSVAGAVHVWPFIVKAGSEINFGVLDGGGGVALVGNINDAGSSWTPVKFPSQVIVDHNLIVNYGATINGRLDVPTGGVHAGNNVAATRPDVSKHLDLYGGSYGLSVTDSTLNLVAGGAATLYLTASAVTVMGTLNTSGTITGPTVNSTGWMNCTQLNSSGYVIGTAVRTSGWAGNPNNGILFMNSGDNYYINCVDNVFNFTGGCNAPNFTAGGAWIRNDGWVWGNVVHTDATMYMRNDNGVYISNEGGRVVCNLDWHSYGALTAGAGVWANNGYYYFAGNAGIWMGWNGARIQFTHDVQVPNLNVGDYPGIYFHGDTNIRINWNAAAGAFFMAGPIDTPQGRLKVFLIDHPTKRDRYLVHGCLEGPTADAFYRGKSDLNGIKEIVLPDYFCDLCDEETATVILTPIVRADVIEITGPVYLAATEVKNGRFQVICMSGSVNRFHWQVTAARKDAPQIVVEPLKSEIDVYGDGPYRHYQMKH